MQLLPKQNESGILSVRGSSPYAVGRKLSPFDINATRASLYVVRIKSWQEAKWDIDVLIVG